MKSRADDAQPRNPLTLVVDVKVHLLFNQEVALEIRERELVTHSLTSANGARLDVFNRGDAILRLESRPEEDLVDDVARVGCLPELPWRHCAKVNVVGEK